MTNAADDKVVFGVNISHDMACAAIVGDEVKVAIAEERLNRVKHCTGATQFGRIIPYRAIRYCCDVLGIHPREVDLFVADLGGLPDGERRTFAANMGKGGEVRITSAWSLDPVQRAAVEDALADAADGPLTFSYAEDPELIAGLRVDAGALVMRANLRDELQFFAAAGR